jgi:glycosyltransferase involved in cell wall biosynthesis
MFIKKNKILFIVPSMRGGGAERVMITLLNHLDRSRFDPILALVKKEGSLLDKLPSDLPIIDLNARNARYAIIKIIRLAWSIKPDVVFSTLGYLNLLIALIKIFLPRNIRLIAREGSIPSVQNKREKYPKIFDWLYTNVYYRFDCIIAQSQYMRRDLIENFSIPDEKVIVINNPVDIERVTLLSGEMGYSYPANKINLLAVGRLSREKGYDLLLQAMKLLDDQYHLTIVGIGPEESRLLKLSKKLELQERVTFIGFQDNPYAWMKNADLMVLSSRYEGFPNVVLEANACGTPVIAFDCPGGTGEIIKNGVNGLLVKCGDYVAMADAIQRFRLMTWNEMKIKENISEKYNINFIMNKYEQLFITKIKE